MAKTLTHQDILSSFAATIAHYSGVMADWCNILPSLDSAAQAYNALPLELQSRLTSRAANYGMDPIELMQKVPEELWEKAEMLGRFLDLMDLSHIHPRSTHPELTSDPGNWIWELRGINHARGAETMTGSEHSEAVDTTKDVANDLSGNTAWWDLNDAFKGFLEAGAALGYSSAWLPKDVWLKMMNSIRNLIANLKAAHGFSAKLKVARQFAINVKDGFLAHKHHVAAAFALGMLTLYWPPAQYFVGMWAMTGLLGIAVHCIRRLSLHGQRKHRFLRLLRVFNQPLKRLEHWLMVARNLLDAIKNGLFYGSYKLVDLVFKSMKAVAKAVQPHIAKTIQRAQTALRWFSAMANRLTARAIRLIFLQ